MSSWWNRTTKEFIPRMSPRDMEGRFPLDAPFVDSNGNAISNTGWIWKPDLTAVGTLDPRYWKSRGDRIVPMSQNEQNAVDAAEQTARIQRERTGSKEELRENRAVMAFVRVVAPKIGMTRAELLGAIDADVDVN